MPAEMLAVGQNVMIRLVMLAMDEVTYCKYQAMFLERERESKPKAYCTEEEGKEIEEVKKMVMYCAIFKSLFFFQCGKEPSDKLRAGFDCGNICFR